MGWINGDVFRQYDMFKNIYLYVYIYTYHLIMYYIYNRDILYMTVDCSLTIETLRSFVSELTRAEANNPTWFSAEPLDVSSTSQVGQTTTIARSLKVKPAAYYTGDTLW